MKTLEGHISISKYTDRDMGSKMHIIIKDELSGCQAIDIEMSVEDFEMAITGQGYLPCTFKFNTSGNIGMKRESKEILVVRMEEINLSDSDIAKHMIKFSPIAKLFHEHWIPRYDDLRNHHKHAGYNKVRVLFERHVKDEG